MANKKEGLLIQMLSEGSKISVMRVMSLAIVMTGLIILIYQAIHCVDNIDWVGACSLISIGLTGKATQKAIEKPKPEPDEVN